MKKWIVLFLLLPVVCLSGCSALQAQCRYVTQVDIFCDHRGTPILRSYTQEDKMTAVLLYLRLLETGDRPTVDPDTLPADVYQITVFRSDGSRQVYAQKAHRYFRQPTGMWQNIPPEQAERLYALMRHFPSDL